MGHYRRMRDGEPIDAPMLSPGRDHEAQVRALLPTSGGEACAEWLGVKAGRGYGLYGSGQRPFGTQLAHRLAWMLEYGSIPSGLEVCHRCDNPPCVNLAHLFLGTHAENMADMARKGRQGGRKLSDAAVGEIRTRIDAGEKHRSIADSFGVHPTLINQIARGKWWRHTAVVITELGEQEEGHGR